MDTFRSATGAFALRVVLQLSTSVPISSHGLSPLLHSALSLSAPSDSSPVSIRHTNIPLFALMCVGDT